MVLKCNGAPNDTRSDFRGIVPLDAQAVVRGLTEEEESQRQAGSRLLEHCFALTHPDSTGEKGAGALHCHWQHASANSPYYGAQSPRYTLHVIRDSPRSAPVRACLPAA